MTNTATQVSISPALQHAVKVLTNIQQAIKKDSGAKADLKRSLTGEARHQRAVYSIVLRELGEVDAKYNKADAKYRLDQWLWVTGFLAYYDQPISPETKTNFGDSARRLKDENSSKGAERRFRALLETSLEDLRSPLTSMVRLMKSKKVAINYPQLVVDLTGWNHPDQYIQDKWARSFWRAPQVEHSED